jgi:hypothetical protein
MIWSQYHAWPIFLAAQWFHGFHGIHRRLYQCSILVLDRSSHYLTTCQAFGTRTWEMYLAGPCDQKIVFAPLCTTSKFIPRSLLKFIRRVVYLTGVCPGLNELSRDHLLLRAAQRHEIAEHEMSKLDPPQFHTPLAQYCLVTADSSAIRSLFSSFACPSRAMIEATSSRT